MKRTILFVLGAALSANAQTLSDPTAATELFKQARAAAQQGDWKTACPKFEESLRLDPKVGTALNLGDCEEKLGMVASSRAHFQRAIDLARAANDGRLAIAQERFAALDKRAPRLTIKLASGSPGKALVRRDSITLGKASLEVPLPIDPGAHAIVVTAPGFADRTYEVAIGEGEEQTLEVAVGAPTGEVPKLESPELLQPRASGSPLRTVGFVTLGVGAATLAGGAIAGLVAIERNGASKADCGLGGDGPNVCGPQGKSARDAARGAGDVASALFVAGGVIAGAGLVLALVAPRAARATATGSIRLELVPFYGVRARF